MPQEAGSGWAWRLAAKVRSRRLELVEDKKEAREVEEYKEQVGAVMEEEEETGEKEVDIVGEEEIGDNDTKSC